MKLFIDFDNPIPIYQEIDFESDEVPFGLSKANRNTNFVGLRCEKLEIIPHVHVTHLETKSHLGGALECLPLSLNEPLLTKIITEDDDEYENESDNMQIQFLIIKKHNPKKRNFEGINLVDQILKKYPNTFVFGINEPSFDAEDAIEMSVHKRFFNHNVHEVIVYLIEMLNLDHVMPGRYYCFLNLFRYGLTDAYPCSPVLYRIPAEMVLSDSCLFCKIIRGVIPSFKVYETNLTYAFLDINPLSEGHIVKRNVLRVYVNHELF